jgi:hypothetical protein
MTLGWSRAMVADTVSRPGYTGVLLTLSVFHLILYIISPASHSLLHHLSPLFPIAFLWLALNKEEK